MAVIGLRFGFVYQLLALVVLLARAVGTPWSVVVGDIPLMLGILAYYPFAGIFAGAIVGLLQPFAGNLIGRAVIGCLAALPVVVGTIPFLPGDGGRGQLWMYVSVTTLVFGVIGSLILASIWRD